MFYLIIQVKMVIPTKTTSFFEPTLKRDINKVFCVVCGKIIYQFLDGNKDPDDLNDAKHFHKKECVGFLQIDKRGRYNPHIKNRSVFILDEATEKLK
jgi:hypothetical protein